MIHTCAADFPSVLEVLQLTTGPDPRKQHQPLVERKKLILLVELTGSVLEKTAPPSSEGRVSTECSLKGPMPTSGEKTLNTRERGEKYQYDLSVPRRSKSRKGKVEVRV